MKVAVQRGGYILDGDRLYSEGEVLGVSDAQGASLCASGAAAMVVTNDILPPLANESEETNGSLPPLVEETKREVKRLEN